MIDIIITTYNSRDTLGDTLESIYKQKDIPIPYVYIVDDGSTCSYEDIINDYKDKLNITFKKNEANKGPGYARNDALSISKGEYIVFIDSDDVFYDDNSISKLYKKMEETKADIVTSVILEEKGDKLISYANELIGLHGKIYRRKAIEDNKVDFLNTYCDEDFYFNSLLRLSAVKIENISDTTYLWKDNKKSITRDNIEKHLEDDCLAYSDAAIKALQLTLKKDVINTDIIIDYCCRSIVDMNYRLRPISNNKVIDASTYNVNKIVHILKKLADIEDVIKYLLDNKYANEKDATHLTWVMGKCKYFNKKLSNYQRSKVGKIHHPLDVELGDQKVKAIELTKKFNEMNPFDYDNKEKMSLLKNMFGYFDTTSILEPPIVANWGCKNVYVGKFCYFNSNTYFEDDGIINIGDNVLVGKGVHFITVNHMVSPTLRRKNLLYTREINIKNNVWIGSNSTILPGVTIGEGSVIGAGSVVTKDIPSNVIAAGNPCKVIRNISLYDELFFDDEIIDYNEEV